MQWEAQRVITSSPKRTLLVVSLTNSASLADDARQAFEAGADLIELRVDRIGDIATIEKLLQGEYATRSIVTVRRVDEGGAWRGDEASRIALIKRLAALRPAYVDIELRTLRESPELRAALSADAALCMIISCHKFGALSHPSDPNSGFHEMRETRGLIRKAVFAPRDAFDAIAWPREYDRWAGADINIVLGVGEAGLLTRVLAPKLGRFLAFATLRAGAEAAPGQPTIHELKTLYRWDEITPATAVYGVVGWPVSHSRSPAVHNAAMRGLGINGVYLPLPVLPSEERLHAFLAEATRSNPPDGLTFNGFSVTVPHKENVLRWLNRQSAVGAATLSRRAQQVGAVNTLVRQGDRWFGDNTDVLGILRALDDATTAWRGGPAHVLGAGGVARAAVAALCEAGCDVTIYNRSYDRAARLAQQFNARSAQWEARCDSLRGLIVNCTTVGMTPHTDESPIPTNALSGATLIMDTVYAPRQTRLLADAAACGIHTVSGVEMFLAQAAAQFELWHERAAPLALMRAAFDESA